MYDVNTINFWIVFLSLGLVIKNELASQSKTLLAMNWT